MDPILRTDDKVAGTCFPNPLVRLSSAVVLFGSLALSTHSLQAQVVAEFTGGNSDEVVDGYRGMAGEGWLGGWVESRNNTTSNPLIINAGVTAANPLGTGGGNYLSVDFEGSTGGANREASVNRLYGDFGTFSKDTAHTVSFLLRFDALSGSFNGSNNTIFIMDGAGNIPNTSTRWAASAWGSNVNDLQWAFSSGAGFSNGVPQTSEEHPRVLSDVFIITGAVYSFEIDVEPAQKRYRVAIENQKFDVIEDPGVGSFISDWLPFTADSTEVAGRVALGVRRSSTNTSTIMSFDSLQIIPEPQTYALGAALVALCAVMIRRRRVG